MKAYALVFGYLCVNAAIWVLNMAGILPVYGAAQANPTTIADWFDFTVFAAVVGTVGGVVIGILALMTKSYALSTGVLLLWVVGVLFKPIQDIFVGLPYLLNAILPSQVWFVTQAFVAFSALILFVFFVEIIAGRPIFESQ